MDRSKSLLILTFGDVIFDQRLRVFARKRFKDKNSLQVPVVRYQPIFTSGPFAYLEYNIRAFIAVLFNSCPVICCMDLDTLPGAMIAKVFRPKKIIYDAHEYFVESPEIRGRSIVKKIWNLLGNFFIPRVNQAYTVGEALADIMGKRYGIHFDVVRNIGAEYQDSHEASSQEILNLSKPYILYQGALNVGRGVESLIESMKYFPALNLVIAGKGDVEEELKKLVHLYELSNVTFTGNIMPQELKRITKEAWLGVNLLENKGLSYYYSLANKFFDYIGGNVPQLCIDFPEYRILNEKYRIAYLVSDCHTSTVVDAIKYLVDHKDEYQRMKENTVEAAGELSWTVEGQRLLGVYHNFLNNQDKQTVA